MESIDVNCLGCDARLRANRTLVGRRIRCSRCALEFRLEPPAPEAIFIAEAAEEGSFPALPHSAATSDPHLGRMFGRYLLVKRLGRGACGAVYQAQDTLLGRAAAVKVLVGGDESSVGTVEIGRFRREAAATAKIEHPNVVSLYDIGVQHGLLYIAMQLVNGGSALSWTGADRCMAPLAATRIVKLAARGLAAAHAHGIIHRDVKPANILVGEMGEVKVADFGMAKMLDQRDQSLTETGTVVGTPHYMSPEQCRAGTVNHLSDIYSLGACYFRLLVGRTPFHHANPAVLMHQQIADRHPDPRSINPAVPDLCVRVIDRAMRKEPASRYPTADEMADALDAVEASLRRDEALMREAERDPGADTVMLDEREVARILEEDPEDTMDKIYGPGRPAPPVETPAALGRPAGSSTPARDGAARPPPQPRAASGGSPPNAKVALKFASRAAAKAALDFLRSDIRTAAGKTIRPAVVRGEHCATLELVLAIGAAAVFGVVKSLLCAGGEFLSIHCDDPALAESIRSQVASLRHV